MYVRTYAITGMKEVEDSGRREKNPLLKNIVVNWRVFFSGFLSFFCLIALVGLCMPQSQVHEKEEKKRIASLAARNFFSKGSFA